MWLCYINLCWLGVWKQNISWLLDLIKYENWSDCVNWLKGINFKERFVQGMPIEKLG